MGLRYYAKNTRAKFGNGGGITHLHRSVYWMMWTDLSALFSRASSLYSQTNVLLIKRQPDFAATKRWLSLYRHGSQSLAPPVQVIWFLGIAKFWFMIDLLVFQGFKKTKHTVHPIKAGWPNLIPTFGNFLKTSPGEDNKNVDAFKPVKLLCSRNFFLAIVVTTSAKSCWPTQRLKTKLRD